MTNAVTLPDGSVLGHSYEYGIDANLGTKAIPNWQPIRRISNFQPSPTPTTQNAQTYDDLGAPNADVTAWVTNLAFAVLVNRNSTTGLYLPEIEALLARTRPDAKGDAAVIECRWYHKPESGTPNPDDAGQGEFTVSIQRANTGADGAVEQLNVTLTGKGPATTIANPFTGWGAAVPTISSITPASAAVGEQVTITGTGFTGATDVTFDTEGTPTSASSFIVVGDATLVAVVPAGSAGDVGVSVTNATGESEDYTYTRGA